MRMLNDEVVWYGLVAVARRAPEVFTKAVWPWLIGVAADLAWSGYEDPSAYRAVRCLEFDDEKGDDEHARKLPAVLAAAVEAWAEQDSESFLGFAAGAWASDLMPAHRILACGLARLAPERPDTVLGYLRADARRLFLGDYKDQQADTCRLIVAAAPYLDGAGLDRLVRAVLGWRCHTDRPGDDARRRFEGCKRHREAQRRLLAAIPAERRPPKVIRSLDEEARALGPAYTPKPATMRTIGPPMTAAQMAKASDAAVIGLFDELVDATGRDHPRDWTRGGSIQASNEFGEFAKANPGRALRLIDAFSPMRHERPVGCALASLAQIEGLEPADLVTLVHRLDGRSFGSAEFRRGAAACLDAVATRVAGLDDRTCALLESWLTDANGPTLGKGTGRERQGSILWQDQGFQAVPGGNYPILRALMLGYLLRRPMAADAWLGVLERHLGRREEPEVWRALVRDLRFLANADQRAAARSIQHLLGAVEGLTDSQDGVALLAWTHEWLPPDVAHACLERWRRGAWPRGPQAAGEFALLRHILVPDDQAVAALCRDVRSGAADTPDSLAGLRLGMGYSAARLWQEERYRAAVTPVWTDLAAAAEAETATALMGVFRRAKVLSNDEHCHRLLTVTLDRPHLLAAGSPFLVDRLKDALRTGFDPRLVGSVALAVAAQIAAGPNDARSRRLRLVRYLVEISLTLQRLPEGREDGVTLFEQLMEIGTYEADEALRSLDRRTLH